MKCNLNTLEAKKPKWTESIRVQFKLNTAQCDGNMHFYFSTLDLKCYSEHVIKVLNLSSNLNVLLSLSDKLSRTHNCIYIHLKEQKVVKNRQVLILLQLKVRT